MTPAKDALEALRRDVERMDLMERVVGHAIPGHGPERERIRQLSERYAQQAMAEDRVARQAQEHYERTYGKPNTTPQSPYLQPMGMDDSLADANRFAAFRLGTDEEKRIAKYL